MTVPLCKHDIRACEGDADGWASMLGMPSVGRWRVLIGQGRSNPNEDLGTLPPPTEGEGSYPVGEDR
jgi:hypothetical protein